MGQLADTPAIDRIAELEAELKQAHYLLGRSKYAEDKARERIAAYEQTIDKALVYTGDGARSHLRDCLAALSAHDELETWSWDDGICPVCGEKTNFAHDCCGHCGITTDMIDDKVLAECGYRLIAAIPEPEA